MGGIEQCDVIWNVDMEVNLFHAMRGHKPAGVNRHFQMISIHDRLSASNKKIGADDVWTHLSRLYDLQALNESEIVPFPNKKGEFELTDYADLSDLCTKSFPRTSYINSPGETPTSKSATKTGKPDLKLSTQSKSTPSSSHKSGHHGSASKSLSHLGAVSTPDPSPKRGKRTRNVLSATNSPNTSEPPSKRRR